MVELEHVTKLYRSVIGVNDICLSLTAGAYGLVGPNGSGKSTLLNLLTGQLRPTLGSVRVLERQPWNNPQVYRQIGVCPEQDASCGGVSGLEWVCYLLRLHGFGRREAQRRARQSLEQVGLTDAMNRPMTGYSRRDAPTHKLAQALAHDPQLLILDEPFNGVDPVGRHQMLDLLHEWISAGKSLLLASHLLHEVEAATQSFLLICGGRLLASGTAQEVRGLLEDLPNEIHIRADDTAGLAKRLIQQDVVESVRFAEQGQVLVLSTRSPAAVYGHLPEWTRGSGIRIQELRSSDSSLQTLFDTLLLIHRGATPGT